MMPQPDPLVLHSMTASTRVSVLAIDKLLSSIYVDDAGVSNPEDIPSRGMLPSELSENQLWLNGPEWLATSSYLSDSPVEIDDNLPEECYSELKCHMVIQLFMSNDHVN